MAHGRQGNVIVCFNGTKTLPDTYDPATETTNEEQVAATQWELLQRNKKFQTIARRWIASSQFRQPVANERAIDVVVVNPPFVAGVVGRINVYALHLPCVVRQQCLERRQQFVHVLPVSLFAWLSHQTVTGKRARQPEWIPLLGKIRDRRDAQRCCVFAAQWWNHGLVRISSKHSRSVIPLPNTIHWSLCRRAQMFQESGPK